MIVRLATLDDTDYLIGKKVYWCSHNHPKLSGLTITIFCFSAIVRHVDGHLITLGAARGKEATRSMISDNFYVEIE